GCGAGWADAWAISGSGTNLRQHRQRRGSRARVARLGCARNLYAAAYYGPSCYGCFMTRAYNFSAGPATLPEAVLRQAQAEMLDWNGVGASIVELSHRGAEFSGIAAQAESDLRELMSIPDDYAVLFLAGGATTQQALLALNFAAPARPSTTWLPATGARPRSGRSRRTSTCTWLPTARLAGSATSRRARRGR